MARYHTFFQHLKFDPVRHHNTKKVLVDDDIKEGAGYCGVAYLRNVIWFESGSVKSADVNLYVTPFEETNPVARRTCHTDHRVMMEGLQLWKDFEKLKNKACDE